jgi:restriction endonuclease S subunit
MSRGRKAIVHNNSDWESVFYNSVGTYVQYINLRLAEHIKSEPLSNHIKIVGGYAFKSSQYKKQGVPVIRISDFSNERIVLDDVVYYEESKDLERYELHEGDIVIALTGGTIAKLGIVQKGIGKLYLNQRVGKFEVLNPEEFENEYVYWIARSVQSIIKNLAWGAAIPNVSPKQIEELKFPIPDKETQNGIIDFLNDLRANKVENDKEYFNSEVEDYVFSLQVNQISSSKMQSELIHQQDLVKQLRQAFLREAMQGKLVRQDKQDGNATNLLEKVKDEKEKLIAEKVLKKGKQLPQIKEEEIPFDIPENWVWCRLGEICNYGSSPKAEPKHLTNNTWVLDLEDIEKETSKLISKVRFSERNSLSTKSVFKKGEVLYSKLRPYLDKVIVADEDGVCTTEILPLKLYGEINPYFLRYSMKRSDFLTYVNSVTRGMKMPRLGTPEGQMALIPLPTISEQERIVKKLDDVMNLCDEIVESITQSKTENEKLINVLLNEALGVTTTYDVSKDKTLKQKIKKFYTDGDIFDTISMKIIEILQISNEPISATVVWNSSEYSKDIEAFYAELKRLIDIEKLVIEEKRGKESFLKLATNEN